MRTNTRPKARLGRRLAIHTLKDRVPAHHEVAGSVPRPKPRDCPAGSALHGARPTSARPPRRRPGVFFPRKTVRFVPSLLLRRMALQHLGARGLSKNSSDACSSRHTCRLGPSTEGRDHRRARERLAAPNGRSSTCVDEHPLGSSRVSRFRHRDPDRDALFAQQQFPTARLGSRPRRRRFRTPPTIL